MRVKITNAKVVDGTGKDAFWGEIVYENDTILEVACKANIEVDTVIDAKGKVICPGFIDTHSHSDVKAMIEKAILPKLHQGITTEVLGQDGLSMAPVPEKYADDWRKNIGGLDGDGEGVNWHLDSMKNYMEEIEKNQGCTNFICLAPHGNIRLAVKGFSDEPATEEEIKKMQEILEKQLLEGAAGMSTGLIYIPCAYGRTDELVGLCKVLKKYNKVFVVHQRMQNEYILESMDELIEIVKQSGVHLHISHFQVDGKDNADMRFEVYKKMEELKALGYEITADQYPYTAGSTMMGAIIPAWAHEGGTNKLLERLQNPETRAKIQYDMTHPESYKGENSLKMAGGPEGIFISSVTKPENERFVGKNLKQLGEMTHKPFLDAIMDLLIDEQNMVGQIIHYTTEECIKDHMLREEINLCTDGLLGGKPHPRVYGAFPRFLGKYARDEKLMSMEKAIYKMTKKAADAMHVADRGVLEKGKKADILILDYENVRDIGTFDDPMHYAQGIEYVIINGITVLEKERVNEQAKSGQVIKSFY